MSLLTTLPFQKSSSTLPLDRTSEIIMNLLARAGLRPLLGPTRRMHEEWREPASGGSKAGGQIAPWCPARVTVKPGNKPATRVGDPPAAT
ncbi:unnamed protein product [Triticum turgidum subsp. durum]|uniref:Uncharacterized protein n=1 Tax=Triticum turgidum subsp. durum TaxID=4567 RepID=A0A9R0Y7F1_TRITD|nr:unnamed protein product [Triticum turgidum subsp. durum]